jgi:hypothetical protein
MMILKILFTRNPRQRPKPTFPSNVPRMTSASRPVIVTHGDGMAFGLSISTSTGAAGSPVQLHLWIDNQTDKAAAVMTCTTLDFFWNEGFDVYDAYGHRLLKKNEIKRRGKEGSPAKPVPDLLRAAR